MPPRPQPRSPKYEEIALNISAAKPKSDRPALKVLLLEDRDDFREVIRDFLLSRAYAVTPVQSGVEGLREIMKERFDLIICDMMMPKMGGEMFYWAVTRVRPATSKHFIFFTGHKNNPPNEFFFKRINATVIYKPFKLSLLESVVSELFLKLGYACARPSLAESTKA